MTYDVATDVEDREVRFVCEKADCKTSVNVQYLDVREMGVLPTCPCGGKMKPVDKDIDWMVNGLTAAGLCQATNHIWENTRDWPPTHLCRRCGLKTERPSPNVFEPGHRCGVCDQPCIETVLSPGAKDGKPVDVCPKCRPLYGIKSARERAKESKEVRS